MIMLATAPVAQRIEQWPPEPCEEVRLFSGASNKNSVSVDLQGIQSFDFYSFHQMVAKKEHVMHFHIYCNQKNLNENHSLAIDEFQKRLSAYCDTTLHTTLTLDLTSDISSNNHLFVIVGNGPSTFSSEEFAKQLNSLQLTGKSTIHVFIGYDENMCYSSLSKLVSYDIPLHMSISNSTFSSETKTLLFYEQLYRAYTILQGKTYHK